MNDERIPKSWEEVTSPMAARVLALALAIKYGEDVPSIATWREAKKLATAMRIREMIKPPKPADFIEPEADQ